MSQNAGDNWSARIGYDCDHNTADNILEGDSWGS